MSTITASQEHQFTIEQLQADVAYLAARARGANQCRFTGERDTGISSNAIVHLAYSGEPVGNSLPSDRPDLNACELAVQRMPEHRKTPVVMEALQNARNVITEKEAQREAERQAAEQINRDREAGRERPTVGCHYVAKCAAYLALPAIRDWLFPALPDDEIIEGLTIMFTHHPTGSAECLREHMVKNWDAQPDRALHDILARNHMKKALEMCVEDWLKYKGMAEPQQLASVEFHGLATV